MKIKPHTISEYFQVPKIKQNTWRKLKLRHFKIVFEQVKYVVLYNWSHSSKNSKVGSALMWGSLTRFWFQNRFSADERFPNQDLVPKAASTLMWGSLTRTWFLLFCLEYTLQFLHITKCPNKPADQVYIWLNIASSLVFFSSLFSGWTGPYQQQGYT